MVASITVYQDVAYYFTELFNVDVHINNRDLPGNKKYVAKMQLNGYEQE